MASKRDELDGTQRAAILLMSLGEQDAANLLKQLDAKDVQRLGMAMAELKEVSRDQMTSVLQKFIGVVDGKADIASGSQDYVRRMLTQAVGKQKTESLLDRLSTGRPARASSRSNGWRPRRWRRSSAANIRRSPPSFSPPGPGTIGEHPAAADPGDAHRSADADRVAERGAAVRAHGIGPAGREAGERRAHPDFAPGRRRADRGEHPQLHGEGQEQRGTRQDRAGQQRDASADQGPPVRLRQPARPSTIAASRRCCARWAPTAWRSRCAAPSRRCRTRSSRTCRSAPPRSSRTTWRRAAR